MEWADARQLYPSQWLLVEAIDAETAGDRRELHDLAVVDRFGGDPRAAWRRYQDLHRRQPDRELYVLHTDREEPDIHELALFLFRRHEVELC